MTTFKIKIALLSFIVLFLFVLKHDALAGTTVTQEFKKSPFDSLLSSAKAMLGVQINALDSFEATAGVGLEYFNNGIGEHKPLVLFVNFEDTIIQDKTLDIKYVRDSFGLGGALYNYFRTISGNKFTLNNGNVTSGYITLNKSEYNDQRPNSPTSDCALFGPDEISNLITKSGASTNLDLYSEIVIIAGGVRCGNFGSVAQKTHLSVAGQAFYKGIAFINANSTTLTTFGFNGLQLVGGLRYIDIAIAHELFHLLGTGVGHANGVDINTDYRYMYTNEGTKPDPGSYGYGNWLDLMGNISLGVYPNSYLKNVVGWSTVADGSLIEIDTVGRHRVTIYPTESTANNVLKSVKVIPLGSKMKSVFIDYLDFTGYNNYPANSVTTQRDKQEPGLVLNFANRSPSNALPHSSEVLYEKSQVFSVPYKFTWGPGDRISHSFSGLTIENIQKNTNGSMSFDVVLLSPTCIMRTPTLSGLPGGVFVGENISLQLKNNNSDACGSTSFLFELREGDILHQEKLISVDPGGTESINLHLPFSRAEGEYNTTVIIKDRYDLGLVNITEDIDFDLKYSECRATPIIEMLSSSPPDGSVVKVGDKISIMFTNKNSSNCQPIDFELTNHNYVLWPSLNIARQNIESSFRLGYRESKSLNISISPPEQNIEIIDDNIRYYLNVTSARSIVDILSFSIDPESVPRIVGLTYIFKKDYFGKDVVVFRATALGLAECESAVWILKDGNDKEIRRRTENECPFYEGPDTPLDLSWELPLSPGKYKVSISLAGFETDPMQVDVRPAPLSNISSSRTDDKLVLVLDANAGSISQPIVTQIIIEDEENNFYDIIGDYFTGKGSIDFNDPIATTWINCGASDKFNSIDGGHSLVSKDSKECVLQTKENKVIIPLDQRKIEDFKFYLRRVSDDKKLESDWVEHVALAPIDFEATDIGTLDRDKGNNEIKRILLPARRSRAGSTEVLESQLKIHNAKIIEAKSADNKDLTIDYDNNLVTFPVTFTSDLTNSTTEVKLKLQGPVPNNVNMEFTVNTGKFDKFVAEGERGNNSKIMDVEYPNYIFPVPVYLSTKNSGGLPVLGVYSSRDDFDRIIIYRKDAEIKIEDVVKSSAGPCSSTGPLCWISKLKTELSKNSLGEYEITDQFTTPGKKYFYRAHVMKTNVASSNLSDQVSFTPFVEYDVKATDIRLIRGLSNPSAVINSILTFNAKDFSSQVVSIDLSKFTVLPQAPGISISFGQSTCDEGASLSFLDSTCLATFNVGGSAVSDGNYSVTIPTSLLGTSKSANFNLVVSTHTQTSKPLIIVTEAQNYSSQKKMDITFEKTGITEGNLVARYVFYPKTAGGSIVHSIIKTMSLNESKFQWDYSSLSINGTYYIAVCRTLPGLVNYYDVCGQADFMLEDGVFKFRF